MELIAPTERCQAGSLGAVSAAPRLPLPIVGGEGASDGDRRLARALAKHSDRVHSVLLRAGIGSGDADDVAHEAFWVLARRLEAVPERAERAFLTTTALRLASDRRRSIWHGIMSRELAVDDWPDGELHSPEELYERQHARGRVDAALARLPDDERSVFLLVELEGMSRQETAHLLGLPAGTVASRLARARAHLETALRALPHGTSTAPRSSGIDSSTTFGNQRYHTNAWGADKTRGRFEQRLVERRRRNKSQKGWFWYWPGYERSVFAYPEVLIGYKPWLGGATTDRRLPVRVADAARLVVDYAVEIRATGSYNLALSTWLSRTGQWTVTPDVRPLTTEIMVWPEYTPGATPPGRFVDVTTVDGESYEIWRAPGHGKHYKRDDGWTVLTLRGVGGRQQGTLALGALLVELGHRGLVEADQYVTCVELGNEVMGGVGTTFVERFAIDL